MRQRHAAFGVAASLCVVLVLLGIPSGASACGGRFHQFSDKAGAGGVLILKERNVACTTVTFIAHRLLRDVRLPVRIEGFECRRENINAGGGAARCTSHRRYVLFGFE